MSSNIMVKTGESETQERRAMAYAADIGGASSTTRLAVVRMDIEEAAECNAITQGQAAGLLRDLDAKVQEVAPRELFQSSQQEFNASAKALCPGGQGPEGQQACKYGINVSVAAADQCALLKTCRAFCAGRVKGVIDAKPDQLGEVELAKRGRLDRAAAQLGVNHITVDSFEH